MTEADRYLQEAADAATLVRADHERQAARIRDDRALSTEGKRQQLAALWDAHKAELDKIEEQYRTKVADRQTALEKRVFQPDGGLHVTPERRAAYRDALDRAEQAGADTDALQLFNRAKITGDDDLVRAVGVIAVQNGWVDTVNAFIETRPAEGAAVEELYHLHARSANVGKMVHEAMLLSPTAPNPALATA